MTIKEKGAMLLMGQKRLPDGYRALLFIGSRGAQKGVNFSSIGRTDYAVDTGFTPDWNTKIWIKCSIAGDNETQYVAGLYSNSVRYDILKATQRMVQFNLNASNVLRVNDVDTENVHTYCVDAKNGIISFDNDLYTPSFVKSGNFGNASLTLFIRNEPQAGTRYKYQADCDVYGFKAFRNEIIERDMIPAEREADGVVGLYDLCGSICSKTNTPFYVNYGTKIFYKGGYV